MKQALISRGRLRSAGGLRAISIIQIQGSEIQYLHMSSPFFQGLIPAADLILPEKGSEVYSRAAGCRSYQTMHMKVP